MRVDCCDFRPKMTKKTSPVVDVIKLFLEEMQTFKISPITETTRIDHFKSYKTVLQYSFAQKQHSFHIFVQVQTSEQTLFHFLILGKSRFPTKKIYNINYREREIETLESRITFTKYSMNWKVKSGNFSLNTRLRILNAQNGSSFDNFVATNLAFFTAFLSQYYRKSQ